MVVVCCWASHTRLGLVPPAGSAVDVAGRDLLFLVGKMFSNLEKGRIVYVPYGVELGPADSVIASQRAFFDRYAFEGVLIFCHYEGDEVISA